MPAKVKKQPPEMTKQYVFHARSSIGVLKAIGPLAMRFKPPYRIPDRIIPEAPARFLLTGEKSGSCRINESVKFCSRDWNMQRSGSAVCSSRKNPFSKAT